MQEYYLLIKTICLLCAIIAFISLLKGDKQNDVVSICEKFFLYLIFAIFTTTLLSLFIIYEIEYFRSYLSLIGFLFLGLASIELSKFSIIVFYDNSKDHQINYVKVLQIIIGIIMIFGVIGIFQSYILTIVAGLFVILLLIIYSILSFNKN